MILRFDFIQGYLGTELDVIERYIICNSSVGSDKENFGVLLVKTCDEIVSDKLKYECESRGLEVIEVINSVLHTVLENFEELLEPAVFDEIGPPF